MIIFNTRRIAPGSWYHEDYGVVLSLPAVIGRAGIMRIVMPVLTEKEKDLLQRSADAIKGKWFHLLKVGANVNQSSNGGWTALIAAAQNNHSAVVKMLIGAGADVNHVTVDGYTLLREAVEKGHTAVADLLRQAGARG